MAIVHDDDLAHFDGTVRLFSYPLRLSSQYRLLGIQGDTLIQHLQDCSPEIQQVQCGKYLEIVIIPSTIGTYWKDFHEDVLLRNKPEIGSGTEVATAKVAMLSENALDISRAGSAGPMISLRPAAFDYSTSSTTLSPMSTLRSSSDGDEDKTPCSPVKQSTSNLDVTGSYRLQEGPCMVEVSAG